MSNFAANQKREPDTTAGDNQEKNQDWWSKFRYSKRTFQDFLKLNWKRGLFVAILFPFLLVISCTRAFTDGVTLAVNIWVVCPVGFIIYCFHFVAPEWAWQLSQQGFRLLNPEIFDTDPRPVTTAPPPPPSPPPTPPPPPLPTVNGQDVVQDYRKISWEQLNLDLSDKDTIWTKIHKEMVAGDVVDPALLAKEFGIINRKGSGFKRVYRVNIMDHRKILNISIVLAHAKLNAEDIRDCLTFGSSRLAPDVLKQLLSFAPDETEIHALTKQHHEDPSVLLTEERFCLEMVTSVPAYKERLRTMLLEAQLKERIEQIKPPLDTIVLACDELRSSEKLKKFLEIVLNVGNMMNGSKTTGFKISFIVKLADMKSSTNRQTTLLDFMSRIIILKFPNVAAVEGDLKHVEEASKVPFKTLDREIDELDEEVKILQEDIERIKSSDTGKEDFFSKNIQIFTQKAKEDLHTVVCLREKAKTHYLEAVEYFGEDAGRAVLDIQEFFSIFSTFLKQLENSLKKCK